MITEDEVRQALRQVIDPELGLDVVSLGMIYAVAIAPPGEVTIQLTLTSPGCPLGPMILQAVVDAVGALAGVTRVEPQLVWEPAWHPGLIAPEARAMLG